jgi:hypothetical protein
MAGVVFRIVAAEKYFETVHAATERTHYDARDDRVSSTSDLQRAES